MTIYKSSDGSTSFELRRTDFSDENGSKTYCFTCRINSHGFTAEVENIWFYREDLLKFSDELDELIKNQKGGKASLNAMSDFSCVVQASDYLGHFTIKTKLESHVYQNSASLMTEAETQSLSNLASELKVITQST